jgi:MMP 1-O-methyltransferase
METALQLAPTIKGFIDPAEGQALLELAAAAGNLGPCLEIGSYCGKSALYLGLGCCRSGSQLYSIDHHRGSEEQQPGEQYFDPELYDWAAMQIDTLGTFRRTLKAAGLEDTVIPIVARSEIAARHWTTPLALVFIDGGHSYEAAFTDYNAWAGHVRPGGFLAIHDIFENPAEGGQAPYRISCLAQQSGLFQAVRRVKTLAVLQRIDLGAMAKKAL